MLLVSLVLVRLAITTVGPIYRQLLFTWKGNPLRKEVWVALPHELVVICPPGPLNYFQRECPPSLGQFHLFLRVLLRVQAGAVGNGIHGDTAKRASQTLTTPPNKPGIPLYHRGGDKPLDPTTPLSNQSCLTETIVDGYCSFP